MPLAVNWRASEASETPSIATYRKKMFGRKYVKTTMRMLTILREAEEWTLVHLREDCLLFASAITKTHQNSMVDTTQTSKTFLFFTRSKPLKLFFETAIFRELFLHTENNQFFFLVKC